MNDITDKLVAFFKPVHVRVLYGYLLFLCLIGLFIPEDILKNNPWAVEFSNTMASIVPQIDKITQLGLRPDSNRFYYSVLWALSPMTIGLMFYLLFIGRKVYYPAHLLKQKKRTMPLLWNIWVLSVTIFIGFFTFTLWDVKANDRLIGLCFNNFLGRSSIGQLTFYMGPIFSIFASINWIILMFDKNNPNNIMRGKK